MQPITLYGRGAVTFHYGKDSYSAQNGVLVIPPALLGQAVAAGFSQTRNVPLDEEAETVAAIADAPIDTPALKLVEGESPAPNPTHDGDILPAIDATRSDDDLLQEFETLAIERGYTGRAPKLIARERLAHLRAGGNGYGRIPVDADEPDGGDGSPDEIVVDEELKKAEDPTSEKPELVELKGADTE